MTYCVAARLKEGMIFVSDTRTNAGIDHISTFKKLHAFGVEGERVLILQTAGNLATSQAVINFLRHDLLSESTNSLNSVPTLFDAARVVGEYANQVAHRAQQTSFQEEGFESTFLLGGQIRGQKPEQYLVYSEGNCIFTTEDTPFFQIGESKYGKPILDRAVRFPTPIDDAIRALLVSFDSTIRSNLSVGFPIDMMVYHNDSLHIPQGIRLDDRDPYYSSIRSQWSHGLIELLKTFDMPPENYKL